MLRLMWWGGCRVVIVIVIFNLPSLDYYILYCFFAFSLY